MVQMIFFYIFVSSITAIIKSSLYNQNIERILFFFSNVFQKRKLKTVIFFYN